MLQPREVSARSQQSAYAETGDMSSIRLPCAGPVRIEACYDDPWQTPITGTLVRIEDHTGKAVVPGLPSGPTTLGLMNFGEQDGTPPVPSLRPELGVFEHPEVARGPVAVALVAEPSAEGEAQALEQEIIASINTFGRSMQTAMQPWIDEWERSGWWGALKTFFEGVKNGAIAWWNSEGDFWGDVWETLKSVPDAVVEGVQNVGEAVMALWAHKDRILDLLKDFAAGAVRGIENGMSYLAEVLRNIPGLQELGEIFGDIVERGTEWAGVMIEMSTRGRVLSLLFTTLTGALLLSPPNFWAEMIGTGGGYLIPEIAISIILIIIAFFASVVGASLLAARIGRWVVTVMAKLGSSNVGRTIMRFFSFIGGLGEKIVNYGKALMRSRAERRAGATDTTVPIVRSSRTARQIGLEKVLKEIDDAGAEVVTDADPEIRDYMNYRAWQMGMDPEDVHAVTLGDTIMVREAQANNPRVLLEELVHVRQQTSGIASTSNIADLEIEAREFIINNGRDYGITVDEIAEATREIDIIRERGY